MLRLKFFKCRQYKIFKWRPVYSWDGKLWWFLPPRPVQMVAGKKFVFGHVRPGWERV